MAAVPTAGVADRAAADAAGGVDGERGGERRERGDRDGGERRERRDRDGDREGGRDGDREGGRRRRRGGRGRGDGESVEQGSDNTESDALVDAQSEAAPASSDEGLWSALEAVDADEWALALPAGLDTLVGSGGRSLTAAHRQGKSMWCDTSGVGRSRTPGPTLGFHLGMSGRILVTDARGALTEGGDWLGGRYGRGGEEPDRKPVWDRFTLVFADGGLTALGTNVTLMALIGVWVGWLVFALVRRVLPSRPASVPAAAAVAALLSVPVAAAAFAGLFLVGGTAPVPAGTLFGAMITWHVLIGIGEAVITYLVVSAVMSVRPDLVHGARHLAPGRAASADREVVAP